MPQSSCHAHRGQQRLTSENINCHDKDNFLGTNVSQFCWYSQVCGHKYVIFCLSSSYCRNIVILADIFGVKVMLLWKARVRVLAMGDRSHGIAECKHGHMTSHWGSGSQYMEPPYTVWIFGYKMAPSKNEQNCTAPIIWWQVSFSNKNPVLISSFLQSMGT